MRIAAPLVILALFAAAAFAFARVQSIWIDETTQLSGLTLPLGQQLAWLAGHTNPIPAVPPDRMPPLSYWLGGAWAGVFGLSEMAMRVFGIVATLCAAPAIWLAGRDLAGGDRAGAQAGALAAVFALAAVYLAPGTIVQAGEIRAYPLYFAISAWAVWAYLRACNRPGATWLLALGLLSLAAGYTHFFGVVMAAMLWLSLLLIRLRRGQPALPVLAGGLVTAALLAGLVPFVRAAIGISEAAEDPGLPALAVDTARMVFRLLLHGVHLSSAVLAAMAVIGTGGLAALALLAVLRRRAAQGAALALPLVLALATLPLLEMAVGSFDVLAPHYNIWLVPVFALFLAQALATPQARPLALACAGLLIASHLVADYRLMRHAGLYSHGSGEWVAAAIADPARTVVVHDGDGRWAFVYFPVSYLTEGRVTQILRRPGQPDQAIGPRGVTPWQGAVSDFPTRIYVSTRSLGSGELAARMDDPGDCGIAPMRPDPGGTAETRSRCAFESTTMVIVRD